MKDLMRFFRLYRPYALQVSLGVVLSLVTLFSGILLLTVSGWFIAAMGIAGAASLAMNYFSPAAMIRGLSILRISGRYGERLMNHDAALRVTSEFRQWFLQRLAPLAPAYLEDLHNADIFSRLRGDIDALERFYLYGFVPILTACIAILLIFMMSFFYLPSLSLFLSCLLITGGFVVPLWMKHAARQDEAAVSTAKRDMAIALADSLNGMAELFACNAWGRARQEIAGVEIHLSSAKDNIHRREAFVQSIMVFFCGVAVSGGMYLAIPFIQDGERNGAEIAMVALFCLASFDIVLPIPAALHSLYRARTAARRIFELADREALIDRPAKNARIPDRNMFLLEMETVSFSYNHTTIFQDVGFSLGAGDVLVICGSSGAGKSTLLDILLGFRRPDSGVVRINGQNAADYKDDDRRSFFACSTQHPYLFNDTIRANLELAGRRGDSVSMAHALKTVCLDEMIAGMPEGLDTYVGENGARLSGGQLRRLAIARALLYPAPCLILDEPGEGMNRALEHRVMTSVLRDARAGGQAVIIFLHEPEKAWLPDRAKVVRL